MSGILEGKRVLITGVLMESSIAFHTAKLAQEQGAEIILTAFPRPTLTERIAKKLPKPTKVIELDVTNDEHLGRLADIVGEELGGLDGVVHSIGFAPQDALGGNFLNTPFESVATPSTSPTATIHFHATVGRPTRNTAGRAATRKRRAEKSSGGKWSRPISMTVKLTPQTAATQTARARWAGLMRRGSRVGTVKHQRRLLHGRM